MSSVVRLAPSISLEDEFADFEVCDKLERELERRLTRRRTWTHGQLLRVSNQWPMMTNSH